MANHQQPDENPSSEAFEEFVAAALKVNPKGLSGKHRREQVTDPELSDEAGS